ncbi:MAG: hypothetical protein H7067_06545 [Burkholderiales bacterium]|nr:hypothetical protein [Opitutaceae bacterium]
MKRIVLDHFHRRAWVFVLGALVQLVLGWSLAYFDARGEQNPLAVFQAQIGLFMGAVLLSMDLNRGITRTLATLPLTPREIGRAWWLATVAIPAPVFSALLVLGALAHHVVYPDIAIHWDKLAGSALKLLLILGAAFTIVLKLPSHPAEGRGWQRLLNLSTGAAWALLFGGGLLLFQDLGDSPYRLVPLLTVGVALTVIGWFRAEHFMLGRATARPVTHNTTSRPGPPHRADGLGGLPLLLRDGFVRAFLYSLTLLACMALLPALQGRLTSWSQVLKHASYASHHLSWFVAFFFLIPSLQQLRLLRSLPLSTNGLAATLLGLIILPLFALGTLATTLNAWALGPREAHLVAIGYLLTLPLVGGMVAVITWKGLRTSTYLLIIGMGILSQIGSFWLQMDLIGRREPGPLLPLVALLSAACIALAFYLTRLAIQRSTLAYRTPGAGGFAPAWAWGR